MLCDKPEILDSVSRRVKKHELFLSFNNDDDCYWFQEWLHENGFELFTAWRVENGRFT